jgi:hypothetical protein
MKKTTLITVLILLGTLVSNTLVNPLYAEIFTSAQSGYFSVGSTWVGGAAPAPYDDIIIATGHTVTLDASGIIVYNITIQSGAVLDNSSYNLTIGNLNVGNPIYLNNGTHNGTGYLVAYDDYKTEISGSGITNCTIEIRSYGLYLLNTCNLTINGNIQHASPGNNGMNSKIFIEAWQIGANLTINGDIITDPVFGGVGIENMAATIIVNGNVSLPGSSSSGSGGIITNGAIATFNISGNLALGPYSSYCQNYGSMIIGGDLTGDFDTYFIQEANSSVKFGSSVFPNDDGFLFAVESPVGGSSLPNTVEYNGTSAQYITLPTDGAYSNLAINNSSSGGVSLNTDIQVNGDLTLAAGLINIAVSNLVLGESSAIIGIPSSSNMIIATGTGEVRKNFASEGSFTFPVGDNNGTAEYSPVTLDFTSGTFADGYVGITLANSPYPGASGSYLNRYWNVTSAGITDFTCNAQFDYVPEDVTGTESNLFCYRVAPTVDQYNAANTSLHQLTANGLTSFGTFTGGEPYSPDFPMAYTVTGGGSYCEGSWGRDVGLSGSELTVTYTLFKNDFAQSPTIAGTGSTISFGNQLFGTYTVIGTNDYGTSLMTGNAVIIENAIVTPGVSIEPDANNVCAGTIVTFTAISENGGDSPIYQWFENGIESGVNAPFYSYVPENGDVVTLLLTSSEPCVLENPVESNAVTTIVNPAPLVTWTTFEPDTLCENWDPVTLTGGMPEGGIYSGNGVSNNMFDPAIAGFGSHIITYIYTDINSCSNQVSLMFFVDVCAGVNTPGTRLVVYPNPASEYLNVMLKDGMYIDRIELFNHVGYKVFSKANLNFTGLYSIPVLNYPAGSYILKITGKNETFVKSVILQ